VRLRSPAADCFDLQAQLTVLEEPPVEHRFGCPLSGSYHDLLGQVALWTAFPPSLVAHDGHD
jgi:hypothetical protein